jgi:hypothetical protein
MLLTYAAQRSSFTSIWLGMSPGKSRVCFARLEKAMIDLIVYRG